ncbi:hypothetical protein E2C01_082033 [Portunus trituberculatus]|uniref:Secreted protein n=1 Tax=Portunus trituberculatus TaxID=210409 RepID=A0A5B7IRB5_PORTR|nr:hypothetical protein [Portunus trituberculatus]
MYSTSPFVEWLVMGVLLLFPREGPASARCRNALRWAGRLCCLGAVPSEASSQHTEHRQHLKYISFT